LRRTIERLYTTVIDVAQFSCDYVKQNRFRTHALSHYLTKPDVRTGRAASSVIALETREKINTFKEDFSKLVEDFNRAVDVETMKIARNIGE
jgi:hypothetical protein